MVQSFTFNNLQSFRFGQFAVKIATQKTQIQLLKEIQDTLPTLTTKEELKAYLDSQLQVLMKYTELTKIATEHFQKTMKASTTELTESTKKLITDTEKQVGRMSASFSNNLSMLHKSNNSTILQTLSGR